MSTENNTFDILVAFANIDTLVGELGNVSDFSGLATMIGEMASQSDARVEVRPLQFPSLLSLSLLPVFTRALLFDAEVDASKTAFVCILANDGRILDLGVPRELVGLAPHLFEKNEEQQITS